VPYEAQNDNASGTGYRECFSSSAAMVARYYGKITSDDAYNKFRAKYGDTTDPQAQVKALKALGLTARFLTNCTVALLEAELDAGRPVLVGWLHKGPVSSPTGGGHWSVVIGYTPTAFIHNDPNGEANLTAGGYLNTTKGKAVTYSRKNWLRRWLVEGPNSGWALLVSR
jgi:ABC-type bacteriocin/lantibiotic exporter with double-glycine peptidase domain